MSLPEPQRARRSSNSKDDVDQSDGSRWGQSSAAIPDAALAISQHANGELLRALLSQTEVGRDPRRSQRIADWCEVRRRLLSCMAGTPP